MSGTNSNKDERVRAFAARRGSASTLSFGADSSLNFPFDYAFESDKDRDASETDPLEPVPIGRMQSDRESRDERKRRDRDFGISDIFKVEKPDESGYWKGYGEYSRPVRRKKKPKGMPKRPLSAYKIFLRREYRRIYGDQLTSSGSDEEYDKKVSVLASDSVLKGEIERSIAKKWNQLSPEVIQLYQELSENDEKRYLREMDEFEWSKLTRGGDDEHTRKSSSDMKMRSNFTQSHRATTGRYGGEGSGSSWQLPPPMERGAFGPSDPMGSMRGPGAMANQFDLSSHYATQIQQAQNIPSLYDQSGVPGALLPPQQSQYSPLQASFLNQDPSFTIAHGRTTQPLQSTPAVPDANAGAAASAQFILPTVQPSQDVLTATNRTNKAVAGNEDIQPSIDPNSAVLPPGVEISMEDENGQSQKYTVNYALFRMTRKEAMQYMQGMVAKGRTDKNELGA